MILQLNQAHVVRAVQTVAVRTDENVVERAVFAAFENVRAVGFGENFGRFGFDERFARRFGFAFDVATLDWHVTQSANDCIDFVETPAFANFVNLRK